MIKAIVFDLQGTLVENGVYPSPLKQTKYILRVNMPFAEYVPTFEKVFMTRKYANLNEAFAHVCDDFKLKIPDFVVEKLVGLWNKNKLLSKPYHDTIDFLKNNKGKYKLVLMANIDCFSTDIIDKYGLKEYFDEIILSCETGRLKNDDGFYDDILERIGVQKGEALIVGDSIESDIDPARKAGIRAVLMDRNDTREFEDKVRNLNDLEEFLNDENAITVE